MKTTKRTLGILLTLAIALTLALPAFAGENDPVITAVTPQNAVARTGESVTFTVEAQAPEGAEDPLAYQWYQWVGNDWQAIEGAASKSLTVAANVEEFVYGDISVSVENLFRGLKKQYRVIVFCDGNEASQDVSARFCPGFIDSFGGSLQLVQLVSTNLLYKIFPDREWDDIAQTVGVPITMLLFPSMLITGTMLWLLSTLTYYAWIANALLPA